MLRTATNNLFHKPTKLLITGRSGTGKSSFAEYWILESTYKKVIIYDSQDGEFARRLGVEPIRSLGEIQHYEGRVICYDPLEDENSFDDFCLFVWEFSGLAGYPVLMVVDELQQEVNQFSLPHDFKQIITRGRRRMIDVLLISSQPNLIHNVVRSQITEMVCFGQADENAIKFVRPFGFGDELFDLPDHCYYRKTLGHDDLHEGKILFSKSGKVSLDKPVLITEVELPADTPAIVPET